MIVDWIGLYDYSYNEFLPLSLFIGQGKPKKTISLIRKPDLSCFTSQLTLRRGWRFPIVEATLSVVLVEQHFCPFQLYSFTRKSSIRTDSFAYPVRNISTRFISSKITQELTSLESALLVTLFATQRSN